MLQLTPREYFVISKQIADPADTDTYYVQAVIRNGRTDAIIDTVNLVDRGGNRFSQEWQVPADTVGEGFYITVTVKVYTDSGYTVQSLMYPTDHETYLVHERANPNSLGGTGGVSVDYKKIKKMIDEALDARPYPVAEPPVPINWQPILTILEGLGAKIDGIKMPTPTDITSLTADLKKVVDFINTFAFPDQKETDLTPVLDELTKVNLPQQAKEAGELLTQVVDGLKKFFGEDMNEMVRQLTSIKKKLDKMPYVVLNPENGKK